MKSLIVFFSLTGNTRKIAEGISLITGSEKRDMKCGEDAGDIRGYHIIFLLSPVWNGKVPGPVRVYMEKRSWDGKKIYPVITNGGLVGRTYQEIVGLCPGARVAPPLSVRFDFRKQRTKDREIEFWVRDVMRRNLMS